jgi:predicted MFS family arabinose efflux permease
MSLGASSEAVPAPRVRIPRESLALAASIFLMISAGNILIPLLPDIQEEFGVSIATAGWIVGSYGLSRLLVNLPAGYLAERVGYRRLSVFAVLISFVSALVGMVAGSVEVLIASRIGAGIGLGIAATVILTSLAATASVTNRGKVMSLFHVANNTGIALYPLVGGIVGLLIGWRATFAVTAVLTAIAGLLLWPTIARITYPRRGTPTRADQVDLARVIHGPRRTLAVLATNLGVVANMIHRHGFRNTIMPLYAATVLGLGGVSIATAIALMSIAGLLVATPGGMMGDRVGRRRIIVAGLTGLAVGDLLFILTGDLLTFLAVATIIGFGDFFVSSQTALLSEIVPPEDRARSLSQYRFSADLGALVGPVVLATIMDEAGATSAILVTVGVLVTAALAARFGVPADGPAARARAAVTTHGSVSATRLSAGPVSGEEGR